jgi:sugar lactone lactonase YvrE
VSNLSDLMPAGASGKTIEAVATATIASKGPVILNSAGTVTEVSGASDALGSATDFSAVSVYPNPIAASYDTNAAKVVVFYGGTSSYLTAAVGTVSGTSVSFGTPVVANSTASTWIWSSYDSTAQKIVVCWSESGVGKAMVGTVTGTGIGFGAETTFEASGVYHTNCVYDANADKTVIAFRDTDDSNNGKAIVGTVTGTGIGFGTAETFDTVYVQFPNQVYDANAQKISIVYQDATLGDGWSIVGTVSGTSISFGTPFRFTTDDLENHVGTYDSVAQKVVYSFRDLGNSSAGTTIVGTISGTDISFGSEVVFTSNGVTKVSTAFQVSGGLVAVVYEDTSDSSKGKIIGGTVTGTSINFGSITTYNTGGIYGGNVITYDSGQTKNVIFWGSVATPTAYQGYGIVNLIGYTNLTTTNFVGIADAGISTSATGTVVVQGGTVTGMSSLTTGGKYYVQDDGTLTSPNATEAYSINGATYDSVSFDVTQDSTITGMCFNGDGTKMYVCGESSDKVYQYSLSSAYDLSTASYDSVSLDVSSQQGAPRSVVFNNDGSALYIVGTSAAAVHQYTLTTPYDLSTGSYASKTVSVSTQELYPCGVIFNNDGASMYVVGSQNDTVYQYTLSTPFDVSTASYASKSMSVNSEQTSPTGLAFNSDGTKIFVIGETTPKINQYTLSSAYDISTGSYDSVSYTYSEGTVPRDIVWGNSGNKFYIPDSGPDDIYQYTAGGGASSSVNAGLALSTTSLLLNGDS